MPQRLLRVLLLVLFAVTFQGCSSTEDDADDLETVGANPGAESSSAGGSSADNGPASAKQTRAGVAPAESDTLMLAYSNDPDTLNLVTANDNVSTSFQRWVYEPLADQKFENPDELEPALAESWEFDKESLEYTIHLRRGVKWHPMRLPDGTPLPETEFTAKDVKFTFDCILNPNIEAAALRSYYEDPDAKDQSERYKIKVSVVDDYTVKAKWTKPYFMSNEFTLVIPMMPLHVYSVDERGEPISFDYSSKEFADGFNNHWANTKMCGTGPLAFDAWRRDERLELKRNPTYWGKPFYFSRVVFQAIPNPNTMLQMGLQNKLDWAPITEKDRFLQSQDHENVKAGKVRLESFFYPGYRYIGYNLRRPFLKDKKVRTALTHAVPVQTIIVEVFKGLAVPTAGPFLPGSSAYDSSIEPLAYDLDKAKALLDEAGWKDSDGDGIRDKQVEGERVKAQYSLTIFSDSPSFLTIAQIVKANCQKIGVNVEIEPAKWALMLQKLRKKDFDATMLGWGMEWKQDPFQLWHGSQADVPESSNAISYQNSEVDALINELRVTLDQEKQQELYHKIHRLIYEDQPYTFLFSEKQTAALNGRIQGLNFYKIRPGYDAREWYATEPRQ
jgi:ABC-type transport system substrate-binding protein